MMKNLNNLPYDYARCAAGGCPMRNDCARFTAPGRPDGWQTFTDFTPNIKDGQCPKFIANSAK